MLQLRRITDQVVKSGSAATDSVTRNLTTVGKRSNEAAKTAYSYAMNHPKSTAAVVLGTAVAAGLLWFVQRNGGYSAVRQQVLQRVRGSGSTRSRRRVASATE
jgi:hypothetical protein